MDSVNAGRALAQQMTIVNRKGLHARASAPLHLVVDLVDTLERMVEEDSLVVTLEGITLARCPVPRAGTVDSRHQVLLIREALRALSPVKRRGKKTA